MSDVTGQEPHAEPPEGQEPEGQVGQEPKPEGTDKGQEPESVDAGSVIKQLRQELARTRKRATEAEGKLSAVDEASKSELQKAVERAERAEKDAVQAAGRLMRYEVAAAKGLGGEWVERLRGETVEEIEADADQLLAQIGPQQQAATAASFDPGARTTPDKKGSPEQEHSKLLLKAIGRER